MSTNQTLDPNYIPDDSEVSSGGSDSWRISQGVICKGRGKPTDKDFAGETREKIVGRLQAIHLYDVTDDSGRTSQVVSATLKTNHGDEIVKVKLTQMTAANTFLYGLTQIKESELVRLTASRGVAKAGAEAPTYANWATVNPMTLACTLIKEPRTDSPGATYDAKAAQNRMLDLIEKLPHFKGVPEAVAGRADSGASTHFAELSDEAERRGWPRIEVNQPAWLALLTRAQLGTFAAIGAVPEATWLSLRQLVAELPAGNVPVEFTAPNPLAGSNPLAG